MVKIKKKKKNKKISINKNDSVEIITEEEYEEYLKGLYGMSYIAGFTSGGMPYGIFEDEEELSTDEKYDTNRVIDDSCFLDI